MSAFTCKSGGVGGGGSLHAQKAKLLTLKESYLFFFFFGFFHSQSQQDVQCKDKILKRVQRVNLKRKGKENGKNIFANYLHICVIVSK